MKAAVYRRYGSPDVVQVEELPTPVPRDGDVLVRIMASTVSSGDARARSLAVPAGFGPLARPVFGFFKPRKPILGTELAGEVAAVGRRVTKFKVGDRVFAFPGFGLGCHAEYRTIPEDGRLLTMPTGATFEEAAAISFGGTTALHFLRDLAKVRPGERVLVIGGSGAVGSAAVQLAKHLGAVVTAVTSGRNVELVRGFGADRVIDYTRRLWSSEGERYDVIFDTVGGADHAGCSASLTEGGRLLLAVATLPQLLGAGWTSRRSGHKVLAGNARERLDDLRDLKALVEAGHFRPLIDSCYPLSKIVEAHARVETGHKRGSVVVLMDGAT